MSYDLLSFGKETKAKKQAANADRTAETQRQQDNYRIALANRGAPLTGDFVPDDLKGRESAVLPYYMGDFEKRWGSELADAWDETKQPTYGQFQDIGTRSKSLQRSSEDAVGSLWNGGLEEKYIKNLQPVAKFKRQSAIDGLNKTLAAIRETQARKGYSGDSYGNRRLALDANIAGANAAGETKVMGERAIRDAMLKMQLDNWDLPNRMQVAASDSLSNPLRQYVSALNQRANIFAPIRVSGQPYEFEKMPSSYQPSFMSGAVDEIGNIAAESYGGYMRGKSPSPQVRHQPQVRYQSNYSPSDWGGYGGGSSWGGSGGSGSSWNTGALGDWGGSDMGGGTGSYMDFEGGGGGEMIA